MMTERERLDGLEAAVRLLVAAVEALAARDAAQAARVAVAAARRIEVPLGAG